MDWFERYVERTPGIQDGEPVIAGTRTPIRTIVELYYHVYPGDFAELRRALGHLSGQQLEAGLAYYQSHQAEIDRHIDRHRKAFERLARA